MQTARRCINFNCGWVVGESPLPDWMKPDNAKVIVIFNKITWHGLPVDVAVPVGRKIRRVRSTG